MFGLYEGVPLVERGQGYTLVLPDKITIFRGPLERAFRSPQALMREVRITVVHELGHHLGFDEDVSRSWAGHERPGDSRSRSTRGRPAAAPAVPGVIETIALGLSLALVFPLLALLPLLADALVCRVFDLSPAAFAEDSSGPDLLVSLGLAEASSWYSWRSSCRRSWP